MVDVGVGAAGEQRGGDAVSAVEQNAHATILKEIAGTDAARGGAGRAGAQYGEMHRAPFRPAAALVAARVALQPPRG